MSEVTEVIHHDNIEHIKEDKIHLHIVSDHL